MPCSGCSALHGVNPNEKRTLYVWGDSIDNVIKSLEDDSINWFKCCLDNQVKASSSKCYLITNKQSCMNRKIIWILKTVFVKNVGVKVDIKIYFSEHLDGLIEKASHKCGLVG